jgi:SNF2 family DNA or RNA helicase
VIRCASGQFQLHRRRRAEKSLRESEERLSLAADEANLGIWIRDLAGDKIWASNKWRELFGFEKAERLDIDRFFQRLHSGNRGGCLVSAPIYFPFQEEGIAFALEREAALIADAMGLGKTAQAVGVINQDPSIHKVLIVCPASVRIPWRRELEKWLARSLSITVAGIDFIPVRDPDILIINYDRLCRLPKAFFEPTYDLAVLDECH